MLKKVAVITDADQGIGIDLVQNLSKRFIGTFYFTSRDVKKGRNALATLIAQGIHLEYFQLDVSNRQSIEGFRDHIQQNHQGIDILINNVAIGNEVLVCDSYEKISKVMNDYYYNYVVVKDILFPLLNNHAKVVYVSKQAEINRIRNQYWYERLTMKHLRESDIDDFLDWYLGAVKNGTFNREDVTEDGMVVPFRMANVLLTTLVALLRKELQPRGITVDLMDPSWSLKMRTLTP